MSSTRRRATFGLVAIALTSAAALAIGQVSLDLSGAPAPFNQAPPSLKDVKPPEPPNLGNFVRDRQAALQLGKALFWDMQVGSDGRTACATCHFAAGADSRSINQMNPGTLGRDLQGRLVPDTVLARGANFHLRADQFPLRVLSNADDRTSPPLRDSNDVVASQGVFNTTFLRAIPGVPEEIVLRAPDPVFRSGWFNVRQVQPRHTPSVINAVFNHRNGWDGAAQNTFNGVNQWGERDTDAHVMRAGPDGALRKFQARLVDSSLASQSVAPIVNPLEMSADGRTPPDLANKLLRSRGKKMSSLRPLASQLVHREDSVLGPLSRGSQPGLNTDYVSLIQRAFRPEWWASAQIVQVVQDGDRETPLIVARPGKELADNEFTQMQYNFTLFFGLALQMYQATLVSDDTPYDRWREGRGTLPDEALIGLDVFLGQQARLLADGTTRRAGARCINCHAGAEFTDASVGSIRAKGLTREREGQDLDRGFNNIGLRPWREDIGVGGRDPWNKWLSVTRMSTEPSGRTIAVDGAVKVPGLRNIALTAPYFRNGGYLTLESVVDFYSRGGDWAPLSGMDGVHIEPLSVPQLALEERIGMVAFLKSLTDERVRLRRAPFDHPQLFIPHGQVENHLWTAPDPLRLGQAMDRLREIPAVGRNGGAPLAGFMQYR